jgi:hypothetical protein
LNSKIRTILLEQQKIMTGMAKIEEEHRPWASFKYAQEKPAVQF